jgi:hypothetical protein
MWHISFWSTLMTLMYWVKQYHKENTEALLNASKEIGLEVNTEKTMYGICSCLITRPQNKFII